MTNQIFDAHDPDPRKPSDDEAEQARALVADAKRGRSLKLLIDTIARLAHGWADDGERRSYNPDELPSLVGRLRQKADRWFASRGARNALRVLDAWIALKHGRGHETRAQIAPDAQVWFTCDLFEPGRDKLIDASNRVFHTDPNEARAAAARVVWSELREEDRKEIGVCP